MESFKTSLESAQSIIVDNNFWEILEFNILQYFADQKKKNIIPPDYNITNIKNIIYTSIYNKSDITQTDLNYLWNIINYNFLYYLSVTPAIDVNFKYHYHILDKYISYINKLLHNKSLIGVLNKWDAFNNSINNIKSILDVIDPVCSENYKIIKNIQDNIYYIFSNSTNHINDLGQDVSIDKLIKFWSKYILYKTQKKYIDFNILTKYLKEIATNHESISLKKLIINVLSSFQFDYLKIQMFDIDAFMELILAKIDKSNHVDGSINIDLSDKKTLNIILDMICNNILKLNDITQVVHTLSYVKNNDIKNIWWEFIEVCTKISNFDYKWKDCIRFIWKKLDNKFYIVLSDLDWFESIIDLEWVNNLQELKIQHPTFIYEY